MLIPETMSPKFRGAQVALLQNCAGHRLKGPKIRGAKVEGPSTYASRSFGAMQPVPRRVLET